MSQDSERSAQVHKTCDLLIRIARLHHRCIEKCFDDTGLHRSQRRMLMHLSRFDTMPSQRKIADDFDISPACVARTLKALASEGYITRADNEDDLRRNTVSITQKGLDTVSETHHTFETIENKAFEGFTAEEINQLNGLFSRIQDNLSCIAESDLHNKNSRKGSASN